MEDKCSFNRFVATPCGPDKRTSRSIDTDIVPLNSCQKDISGHKKFLGISEVQSEVELILARASIFTIPPNIEELTICPGHRDALGIGWRRGIRCRVPPPIANHAIKGKTCKAERGLNKTQSKTILRRTGLFIPVGSGKCKIYVYTYVILVCNFNCIFIG